MCVGCVGRGFGCACARVCVHVRALVSVNLCHFLLLLFEHSVNGCNLIMKVIHDHIWRDWHSSKKIGRGLSKEVCKQLLRRHQPAC